MQYLLYIFIIEILILTLFLKDNLLKLYYILTSYLFVLLIKLVAFIFPIIPQKKSFESFFNFADIQIVQIPFIFYLVFFIIIIFINIEYIILKKNELFLTEYFKFLLKGKKVVNNIYLLDSSSILDKRLIFLLSEEILQGVFVIPDFVMEELKRIAFKDENKSTLVYESLDNIKKLQKKFPVVVKITKHEKFKGPVDERLIQYSQKLKCVLITNDFELYQKAKLYQIKAININIIANNMKISKLPGDRIKVKIIKEGKESNQGVGYLEDGTMVVVKEGINYMNKEIEVIITSIIQTNAGRILFGEKV